MPKFAVKIIRATSLALGQGKLKPEAYVKLTLGSQPKQKTKIIKGFDPVWNEWFDFDRWSKGDKLVVEVKHSNTLNTNVNLGKYVVEYPTDKTGHTKSKVALTMDKVYNKRGNQSYLEFEIINVAMKQAQAAMQYQVSNEKGEELIRKMMQGSDWTMYTEKSGKMKTREVNLYYCSDTADGYPIGSIIWTGDDDGCPKPADVSSKHVLAVHTLTDIYIGAPCPHASAVKSSIDKDLLMTFKGEKQFDFVCSSDQIVDDWIKGLRYAIISKGKKCANVDVGGAASGESKKAATSWDHPANDTVQQMLDGFDMVAYWNASSPRKENVFVWYSRKGGKYGSIYWSKGAGSKREDPSKCIYLHQLTDIYVGKQQKIFQGPIASDVEDQCCFSVVSKRRSARVELHLQAQSVEVMKNWMVGINHILTTTGRKVVLESETGEKKTTAKGRRFSRHFSVAVRAKSTHPGVLKMADGAYFTRYRQKKSKKDRSVKTQIFVFHSRLGGKDAGSHATGALFWYEKADKDKEVEDRKKDRRCIPVHSITDIYCGQQHEIFKTKVANESKDDCVFSIKGAEVSKGNKENFLLHLEAESPEVVKTWMDAIAHLLQGGGRSVEQVGEGDNKNQEGQSSDTVESPSGTKTKGLGGKRMSVAPPSNDPLDMFGFDAFSAEPKSEDINGMFPESRPANPFDDAQGGWDPFSDSPAPGAPPPADDLSSFFGNPAPTSPKSPKVGEVPVLFPGQDSVWGNPQGDPFGSSAPPKDTSNTQSDPFGAPPTESKDPFGASDPFSTPGTTDPFSTPGTTDPFSAPPTEGTDDTGFGDIFGAPAPESTSQPQEGIGEMARFLMSIGLEKFTKKFEEEQVDMDALRMFSKSDLKEMGLPTGPAIKILKTLPNWKG